MTFSNSTMDPKLWGSLQHHINLEDVYLRLPLREFFQLRGVCKDWNSLAHQRRCFTEGVQKPYFVIVYPVTCPGVPYHAGILTLHIESGQWRWKPLPVDSNQLNPLYVPFSVNGMIFHSIGAFSHRIYDTHIKKKYTIFTDTRTTGRPRVLAMVIDTSVKPHKVRIILGGLDTDTMIFEVGSDLHGFQFIKPWEVRPSRIPSISSKRWPSCMKSCLQCDDRVYVWRETDMILVYSLTEDTWTTLDPPKNNGTGGALGCWDSRLFIVVEDEALTVSVWELVEGSWRRFARIPGEMLAWLVIDAGESVLANFCDQYVLIYTLLGKNSSKTGISDTFVLFDLATKQWEKTGLWDRTLSDTDDSRRLRKTVERAGR